MFILDLVEGPKSLSLEELLLEGAADRYRQLFQGIIQFNPKLEKNINAEIKWAISNLKKDDRIIWYLRYVQIYMMMQNMAQTPEGQQSFNKKLNQVARKAGVTPEQITQAAKEISDPNIKHNLEHYLSLPIQEITGTQFAWQMPSQVMQTFGEAEAEWKENQKRVVDAEDEHEVVIDFKDGYKWFNLNRASCSAEAKAMGHCGNSPRSYSDDTILSLRKDVTMGKEGVKHSPVLTFILNNNNYLTEMKGRGNDKPAARYHKYIIALLKHDMVEGIRGGGYLPENNFSINDLDDDTKDALLADKPELAGPMERIHKMIEDGKFDTLKDDLTNLMNEDNMEYNEFEFEEKLTTKNYHYTSIRLATFDDYEEFAGITDDKAVKSLYEVLDDLKSMQSQSAWFKENPKWYKEWLHKNGYSKLANKKQFQLFKDNPDLPSEDEVKQKIIDEMGPDADEFVKQINDRLKKYADAGFSADGVYQLQFGPTEGKKPLGKWGMYISLGDLLEILDASDDGYDDNAYTKHAWSEYVDPSHYIKADEYIEEQRSEQDLNGIHEVDDVATDIKEELEELEDDE